VNQLLIKRLAPEEYEVLKSVQEGYCPDSEHSIAIVAQKENEIVGRMLLIRPFHIEGTWISEKCRSGTIAVRMIKLMEAEARKIGLSHVFAYAATPEIEEYMERLGYKRQKMSVWMKEV